MLYIFALNGSFESLLVLDNINIMAVVVAAVASFVLGGYWYYEKVFGRRWQNLVGLNKKDIENTNMTHLLIGALLLTFVQALFLAFVMASLNITHTIEGFLFGSLVGLTFGAASLGVQYLYAQRKLELFAIDAGYIVAQFAIMGLILGWWQ